MENFTMYRRRLIPNECILLDKDVILSFEGNRLVTSWNAIRPKKNLHHGISCFFFDDGIKLSKFYREDNSLVYWYIDMISASFSDTEPDLSLPFSAPDEDEPFVVPDMLLSENSSDSASIRKPSLIVTDLLADILIYPDGFVKVVDLGEISDAITQNLLDEKTACLALRLTDRTLEDIYKGDFKEKQRYLESFESFS
ncbi:MAG: DUF402 domain-containing protein [Lachnospiraceae bacterium]|nr:DUF402 domain-containing protein [Lachnospiraceae bacterium]